MQILDVKNLSLPEVKVIRFKRFPDNRGYFSETFGKSDFENNKDINFLNTKNFVQVNDAFSRAGVIRGFHFQFNPYMGKMIRTLQGRMIDFALDIRKDSETFGKILAFDMPYSSDDDYGEWIWIPVGFAHGNLMTQDSRVEYFCTGQYNPAGEVGISPLASDIDWSLCDARLKEIFDKTARTVKDSGLMSEKDINGLSLSEWINDDRSEKFTIKEIESSDGPHSHYDNNCEQDYFAKGITFLKKLGPK